MKVVKFYCDRCHKEVAIDHRGFIEVGNNSDMDMETESFKGIDLCDTCKQMIIDLVDDFISNNPKVPEMDVDVEETAEETTEETEETAEEVVTAAVPKPHTNKNIDTKAVCKAYLEEQKPINQIASEFGISWATVDYHLKKGGLR